MRQVTILLHCYSNRFKPFRRAEETKEESGKERQTHFLFLIKTHPGNKALWTKEPSSADSYGACERPSPISSGTDGFPLRRKSGKGHSLVSNVTSRDLYEILH